MVVSSHASGVLLARLDFCKILAATRALMGNDFSLLQVGVHSPVTDNRNAAPWKV